MHPSPAVIIFTSLSGLGFGLLVFLGLQMPDVMGFFAFIFFTIGFGLAVGGLVASTFHLGRPERSLKAFKQWRSSWLQRSHSCSFYAFCNGTLWNRENIF
jgi:DMSO reductase anchor subunit